MTFSENLYRCGSDALITYTALYATKHALPGHGLPERVSANQRGQVVPG